ncbi:MAG: DoxX family protein [Pyrinomonadaceae bacterium]|nr:DoxX family protein [Pyrinomonadaceae bacterium]
MTKTKIAYFVSTALLTLLMLFSAGMYFFNHAEVATIFTSLGYPTYIIYPLAIAKILGLIAIWSNYSRLLRDFAYAGFFYDFVLALSAHLNAGDGDWAGSVVALVLWTVSFATGKKLYKD